MRLYLTGADGMLGTALTAALREDPSTSDWPVLGVSADDFDIADADAVHRSIDAFRPDVVVHAAANAIVDECEANPELALRVNVTGTHNVAQACRRHRSRLVYLSSDYVFDGARTPPGGYREADAPNPLSVYGRTKLAGERISATVADHLIVRTSWLFGGARERTDNLLATIRQAQRGQRARLVYDQYGCPTYTVDLAHAITYLLTRDEPVTGTVHIASTGSTSWHHAGALALAAFDPDLARTHAPEPVALDDCGLLAGRPRNSSLSSDRLAGIGFPMPSWYDAVHRFAAALADAAAVDAVPVGEEPAGAAPVAAAPVPVPAGAGR